MIASVRSALRRAITLTDDEVAAVWRALEISSTLLRGSIPRPERLALQHGHRAANQPPTRSVPDAHVGASVRIRADQGAVTIITSDPDDMAAVADPVPVTIVAI